MPRAKKKEAEAPAVAETVQRMPLSELHPFEGHPFKVLDDDAMAETVESIRQMGVANPLIVRPDPDGGYEIISGHRRHHAAELAGLDAMGIRYIAINDNYDSMAPGSGSDVITLPFKNLVNDIYCRDISIKIRTSLEVKRKKGEYVGSFVPFGYRKAPQDKNRLLVDEAAADADAAAERA